MLKKLLLNKRTIPVPIPIKTLDEAAIWVEQNFVPPSYSITRIFLDGQDVMEEIGAVANDGKSRRPIFLHSKSNLEIQIDSPVELAIQSLETIRNLVDVMLQMVKPLAIECWEMTSFQKSAKLEMTYEDFGLIIELWHNYCDINPVKIPDLKAIFSIETSLEKLYLELGHLKEKAEWKGCAKIILNKIEPLLKSFLTEAERLQSEMYLEKSKTNPYKSPPRETRVL